MSIKTLNILGLCCAAAIVQPALAEVVDDFESTPLATLFGSAPTISNPKLWPTGTGITFTQQSEDGVGFLLALEFSTGSIAQLLGGSERGFEIQYCDFANPTRLLCEMRQGRPGRGETYYGLYAVDINGENLQEMNRPDCQLFEQFRDGLIMSWLPNDPENVLLCNGTNVGELGVNNRRYVQRYAPQRAGQGPQWLIDGEGDTILYRTIVADLDQWFMRTAQNGSWEEIFVSNPQRYEEFLRPIGFGSDKSELLHYSRDGHKWNLSAMTLSGDHASRTIASNPASDIGIPVKIGRDDRVVAMKHLDGRPQLNIIDNEVQAVYDAAAATFANHNIEVVDESWDGLVYLVLARPPGGAGTYYLYNADANSWAGIGPAYPQLAETPLATTQTVQYQARDGATITGHLTLPNSGAEPFPTVLMPRNRPSQLDTADPHYMVQFLAASGYAVMRVEHRGAEEYNYAWQEETSVLGWEEAANDIADAAAYLESQGISASGRYCGLGWDYGAHTALMTSVAHPDLLECIVSIAGVSAPREIPSWGNMPLSVLNTFANDEIDAASPGRRAGDIGASSVLLFQAHGDPVVQLDQSVSFEKQLDRADVDVELIEYEYDNHDIRRAPHRIDMLTRIGEFLDDNIN